MLHLNLRRKTDHRVRIDVDGPDVDMDGGGYLFHRGVPFTGAVAEYQNGCLISLDQCVGGISHGLERETLRSEAAARHGLTVGESREWPDALATRWHDREGTNV